MDFEGLNFNQINWKKTLKVVVIFLASLFVLRLIVMTLFFGEAYKFVKDFNNEFTAGQQAIHKKIESEHDDFHTRTAEFDRVHEKIGQDFQELRENFEKNWKSSPNTLAEEVNEAKQQYKTKLNQCKADKACQEYLKD